VESKLLPPVRSLAVLPLQNLTGNPENEYLTDGMTDELITDLAKLDAVRVISHISVMRFKGTQKPLAEIARELNVDAIVEGTVQNTNGRIHVSVQLVQAQPEKHLWAESYNRSLGDIVALQEELTREIAGAIRISITPQNQARLSRAHNISPGAYESYLKGRYFWNRRTAEDFKRAIDQFQQAIARDSGYAEAYAGLADSYLLLGGYYVAPQSESIPKARAAAQTALKLDSALAEAHASLGLIAMNYDWNWAESERQYRQAIALNPNYATAHHWYAEYLAAMGRSNEALAEIQAAETLDPLSSIISSDRGKYLYLGRHYDMAIAQCRATLEMDPNFVIVHNWLAQAEMGKGMFGESIAELDKVRDRDDSLHSSALLVYAYAATGRKMDATRILSDLQRLSERQHVDASHMVISYLGVGDKERALSWLEKAYAEHSVALTSLKVHPMYDPLRSDPRFTDLMHRVGLKPAR
jgi:TolB-like protein/Tfp pilus assembly protein PilF